MSNTLNVVNWGGEHSRPIVVGGASCWNGLASNPYHLWALRRAELTAFTSSPFRNLEGNPAIMGHVRQLEPRLFGAERMVELLKLGLRDILPTLSELPRDGQLAVVLSLPERMSSERATPRDRHVRERLVRALTDSLIGADVEHFVHVEARGHASGVFATLQAANAIMSRAVPAVLIGGIDSYYDPFIVEELLEQDRILDAGHLDAMIPGEGVAFAVLTRRSTARHAGLPFLAHIEGAAINHEPATIENDVGLLGLGLSRAAKALGQRLEKEQRSLDWWISDMTPEHFRVQELQLAWPRAARGLMAPESELEHLPHHLGDLGAATIPTGIALATQGFLRGDPPAKNCLLTASSNGGERGTLLLAQAD